MIAFIALVMFAHVSGFVLGAWIGLPYFERRKSKPTIPQAWVAHMADLNRPAVWRRR